MRIALVIEHLDPRRGGAEVYLHDFARWLLARGHQVLILAQDAHQMPPGAELHTVRAAGLSRAARLAGFARGAADKLRQLAPDAALATGKALGQTVYQPHGGTVRGSQRQNLALVRSDAARALKTIFNRLSPKHRAALRLERQQFADPRTHFVAISDLVRRDMKTFYRLPDERITLIYNGVDLERFDPARLRPLRAEARRQFPVGDETVLFLLAAHNFRLKGLRELLLATKALEARLGRTGFHLAVVGHGRRGPFREIVRKLKMQKLVTFGGDVPDMARLYAAADVLVHPTWYDPCSLVALEALASGLPVITTRFNGAAEMMLASPFGEPGIVLDAPRPVGQLAEALARMLDAGSRQAMAVAARQTAEQYPQERNFAAMLECLTRSAARVK